jgi:hypothetical protein
MKTNKQANWDYEDGFKLGVNQSRSGKNQDFALLTALGMRKPAHRQGFINGYEFGKKA